LKTNRKTLRHRVTGKHRTMWPTISLLLLMMMCVCAFGQELPKVVVLSTGGTIASKQDPVKGGYVPALSGEDLVAAVPAIKKIAQIQVESDF
jgi:L-asparaginase